MTNINKILKKLVSINSVYPNEQNLSNWIYNYLKNITPNVKRISSSENRDNIIATIGESSKYICFVGHLDTVKPDILYSNNPFKMRVANDIAYGLGVSDMKGGIAIILKVAEFAKQKKIPMKLAFAVDEENISSGSYTLCNSTFFKDVFMIISAENGQAFDEHQPFTVNYGRKGRFVLKIKSIGKTAHAARKDQAVNAITQLSKIIELIEKINFKPHSILGHVDISPFSISSNTESFSTPAEAYMLANVLTVPGNTKESIIKIITDTLVNNSLKAEVSILERETPYMDAYEVDNKLEIIKNLEDKIFKKYNVNPSYAISVADENRYANMLKIPVISIGPVGGGDHTAFEWLNLKSFNQTVEVYKEVLEFLNEN